MDILLNISLGLVNFCLVKNFQVYIYYSYYCQPCKLHNKMHDVSFMSFYLIVYSTDVGVVPLFEINRIVEASGQMSPFVACFSLSDRVGIDIILTATTIPETANRTSLPIYRHV